MWVRGGDVVELGDEQLSALADLRDELLTGESFTAVSFFVLAGPPVAVRRCDRRLTLAVVPLTYQTRSLQTRLAPSCAVTPTSAAPSTGHDDGLG